MKNRRLKTAHWQHGLAGVLLSGVLSAALVVAGTQGAHKANMNAYHAGNKASIEEANQLMQSGLRYTNGLLQSTAMLDSLLKRYANDQQVVLTCDTQNPIPKTLVPNVLVENLWTPEGNKQEVRIKAIFAPYDCNKKIGLDNFQAAFEVTGSTGCNNSRDVNSELCAARAVVMTAYKGDDYNPVITKPPEQKDDKKNDHKEDNDKKEDNKKDSEQKDKQKEDPKKDDDEKNNDKKADNKKDDKPDRTERRRVKRKNVGL